MKIPGTRPAALLLAILMACALLMHVAVAKVACIAPSGHSAACIVALDVCGQGHTGTAVQVPDLLPDLGSGVIAPEALAPADGAAFPPSPDDVASSEYPRDIYIPPEHPQP